MSIKMASLPRLLYGTAWKEDQTQRLTELALRQGFRGIDTANQRRHYQEAAVGQGIHASFNSGLVGRDDLFLQTKFTFRRGHDERLPYDAEATISIQVEQSFDSSLRHLGTHSVDSYLLHAPSVRNGLSPADWGAWRAMEKIYDSGRARFLGICNVSLDQLNRLSDGARVQPTFVQNRCHAAKGWDHEIRQFCKTNGLVYQGFGLLTGNRDMLASPEFIQIAKRHGRSVSQIVFRFAIDVGMIAITGTSDASHMNADLQVFEFELEQGEVERMEWLAQSALRMKL